MVMASMCVCAHVRFDSKISLFLVKYSILPSYMNITYLIEIDVKREMLNNVS